MPKERVLLAYKGGPTTSTVLWWLQQRGYDVVCFIADVGQSAAVADLEARALRQGAAKVVVADLQRDFLTEFVLPTIQTNALHDGKDPMGFAIARSCIARHQVAVAEQLGIALLAHGAAGHGNDQLRFELTYYAFLPQVAVVAPLRETEFLQRFPGGAEMREFCLREGLLREDELGDGEWVTDDNLMTTTHESTLSDPGMPVPGLKRLRELEQAPDEAESISVEFQDGLPVRVVHLGAANVTKSDALEIFRYLNELGSKHAIGRVDMVENRVIGIKCRCVYESPGAAILRAAHMDIEGIAMDREVYKLREMFAPKFAELAYSGAWYSPEMDFIMAAMRRSQEVIDGTVVLKLYKGNAVPVSRVSASSLWDSSRLAREIKEGYNPKDATGYIRVHAQRLSAHRNILDRYNAAARPAAATQHRRSTLGLRQA